MKHRIPQYTPKVRAENARSAERAKRYAALFPVSKTRPLTFVERAEDVITPAQAEAIRQLAPIAPFEGTRLPA